MTRGTVYRDKETWCLSCKRRVTKAQREACAGAGHRIEVRNSKTWRYSFWRNGKQFRMSSGSKKKTVALRLLGQAVGKVANGEKPIIGRIRFEEARDNLVTYYDVNGKRSTKEVRRRTAKHLTPFFEGRLMTDIGPGDVRDYIAHRKAQTEVVKAAYDLRAPNGKVHRVPEKRYATAGPSNGEINRELALLKQMFSLLVKDGRLHATPHIPMLDEDNVRQGFFEDAQLAAVLAHLPADIRPVIEFAHETGWRIDSEVLPLEWRHVNFTAGEVRLDPGTTKNREGRVIKMTARLRTLLEARHAEHEARKKSGQILPWVFVRLVKVGRGESAKIEPRRIVTFLKAWRTATRKAACPGRIPHDLRRTAVRNFVQKGIPERVAMMLTGHKTRSVFDRYHVGAETDLADAARRLDEARGDVMPAKGRSSTA
ncbi:MAG: tyrosine-type recombinase/integrase [Vicinamibacterales bacterium]